MLRFRKKMGTPSVLGFNANEKSTVLSAMTVPVRPVVAERLRPGVSAVFGGNWTKAPRAEMMETRRMPAVAAAGVRLNDTIICLRSRFDEDSFQVCASGVRSFESIRP